MLGIDVSENNGQITDWQAIANAGVKFVMVRATYGKYSQDEEFLSNVNGAHAAGLQCGAYHYSYALDIYDAIAEAFNTKSYIDKCGVLLELPVFFDMEDADNYKLNHNFDFKRDNITNICKYYLDNLPYNKGVYASYSWITNYIDWQSLGCAVWNAEWLNFVPDDVSNCLDYDDFGGYIWQYSDRLKIADYTFDANWLYD